MYLTMLILLCSAVAVVLYKSVLAFAEHRRRVTEAARRGCAPVRLLPKRDPLGLLELKKTLEAGREHRHLDHVIECMDAVGQDIHTFQDNVLGHKFLATRDPENVQALLATQAQDFDLTPNRLGALGPFLGRGIFTATGDYWRHSRAMIRSKFDRDQVSDLGLQERHVQVLYEALAAGDDGWTETCDLTPIFLAYAMDIGTEIIFGQSTNNLAAYASDSNLAKRAYCASGEDLNSHLHSISDMLLPRAALMNYYWLASPPAFFRHCKKVHRFVDTYVEEILGRPIDPEAKPTNTKRFVLLEELARETREPLRLRYECLNVLIASRTSTASFISYTFAYLSRDLAVFQKLRAIVLNQFGLFNNPHDLTFENLKACQYLHWCLNEALRLGAPLSMNIRKAIRDTILPRGGGPEGRQPIFVPKGHEIFFFPYAMQHRADIWGEDVEDFRPERWEGRKFGWEFVPFGNVHWS
ncbi:hypothetical protein MMC12_007870 [Toensbergia leucococca]|nr:hypothetical protein [Toensbergia leucococca]